MKEKRFKKIVALLLVAVSALVFTGAAHENIGIVDASAHGERQMLYIGGVPFGIRIYRDGIVVVGVSGDSIHEDEEGIKVGDVILEVNGKKTESVKDLTDEVHSSGGEPLVLTVKRDGEVFKLNIKPYQKDGEYVLGIWTKSGVAGIGTVTYIDPRSQKFGGLGHGICDDKGKPLTFRYGDTEQVEITEITKGVPGAPGEIHGILGDKTGRVTENSECGIFGIFASIPEKVEKKLYEAAYPDEVTEGEVTLVCGLYGGEPVEYEAEIIKITDRRAETKNFIIRVTDQKLLELTGGIVQGMSGSPVLQNGRLIGAVTHVLVADPTCGYGIFINRMLSKQK